MLLLEACFYWRNKGKYIITIIKKYLQLAVLTALSKDGVQDSKVAQPYIVVSPKIPVSKDADWPQKPPDLISRTFVLFQIIKF